ncbi:unnamed protein product [Dicrocoelium dendriticum]|nr:unnamed protein product [Dicrocoelium dendriticum]
MLIELFADTVSQQLESIPEYMQKYEWSMARVVDLETKHWLSFTITPIQRGAARRLLAWIVGRIINLTKRPLLNRLDWLLRRALNNALSTLHLPVLFAHPQQTGLRGDVVVQKPRYSLDKRVTPEPRKTLAIPLG